MSRSRVVSVKKEEVSEEMAALLKNQKAIKEWQALVKTRLYEMEDAYLRDTPFGNIVRGFEVEGGTRSRQSAGCDGPCAVVRRGRCGRSERNIRT